MPANVKVELINPSTDEVVDTVTADGVLPDVHKYASTIGFPHTRRTAEGLALFWNSAFIFQGIMCNSEQVDSSKSKCTFKPFIDVTARGNYCTDAFTKTYDDIAYKMGDLDKRYGYYNNTLSGNTLDSCVKVWEWDTANGNGNINSICLTTPQAAITYNKDFPEDMVALPKTSIYPLTGITRYTSFPSSIPKIDSVANLTDSADYITSLIDVDLSSTDGAKISFYETTKNIVFLKILGEDYTYNGVTYPAKRNEQQEDGTYVTRVYYKIVDKKWLYKYRQPIFGSENTGDTYEVYHPIATFRSSHIIANADGYIDINTGTSELNFGSENPVFCRVEDNAYAILGLRYDDGVRNNPIDYDANVYMNYFKKSRYYAISGDTPTLEVFDSLYNTPIHYDPATTYASSQEEALFTRDRCVILRYYRSGRYNFIEKRTLSGFNLVWRNDLGTTAPTNTSFVAYSSSVIDQIYGAGKYYAILYLYQGDSGASSREAPRVSAILDMDNGEIVGYATGSPMDITSYKLVYYDLESPFRLYYTQYSSSYDLKLAMYTNFFTMKCNLPRTIVKTADYKMRVTVEIIPE